MSSRAGHEQQMFEHVNGQELVFKRTQWGKSPRQIKNLPIRKLTAVLEQEWHVYLSPLSRSIDIDFWQVPHMHRTKTESDKEAVPRVVALCVQLFGGQDK